MKLKAIGLCAAALGLLTVLAGAPVTQTVFAGTLGNGPGTKDSNISQNTTVGAETYFDINPDPNADPKQEAKAMSTAEFSVVPSTLQLVAVPDMNFGKVDASTVTDGGKQELVNSDVTAGVSKGTNAHDGNNQGFVIIRDYRGIASGWTLSLSMAPMFQAKETEIKELKGITLDIKTIEAENNFKDKLDMSGEAIDGHAKAIVTAGKDHGAGQTKYTLGAGSASLNFPSAVNKTFTTEANYQSELTWTLVAAQ